MRKPKGFMFDLDGTLVDSVYEHVLAWRRALEEVRMLSNLETEKSKLLQIVLVGQPELLDKIRTPGMAQLDQRVSIRCRLTYLNEQETDRYIASPGQALGYMVGGLEIQRIRAEAERAAGAFAPILALDATVAIDRLDELAIGVVSECLVDGHIGALRANPARLTVRAKAARATCVGNCE